MRVLIPEQLSAYGRSADVEATTVAEALEALFRQHPRLRERVLDARGALLPHLLLFRNGGRAALRDAVGPRDEIEIFLAAEGG